MQQIQMHACSSCHGGVAATHALEVPVIAALGQRTCTDVAHKYVVSVQCAMRSLATLLLEVDLAVIQIQPLWHAQPLQHQILARQSIVHGVEACARHPRHGIWD